MILEFKNSKDSKNIHHFLGAIKSINEFVPNDVNQKCFYIFLSKDEVRLSSTEATIYGSCSYTACYYALKKGAYWLKTPENAEESVIYRVDSQLLLKFINAKIQKKLSTLELAFSDDQEDLLTVSFSSTAYQDCELVGTMELNVQKLNQQSLPFPHQANNGKLVPYCMFSDESCRQININENNIWIEARDKDVLFQGIKDNRCVEEFSISTTQMSLYDHIRLKTELKMKMCMNLCDKKLMAHLDLCAKLKKGCKASLVLIKERYQYESEDQDENRYTFMLLETDTEWASTSKVLPCYLGTAIKLSSITIVRPPAQENKLLKAQQTIQSLRRAVLNHNLGLKNEIDIAEGLHNESIPHGKFEEGEETFTKKRKIEIF